PIHPTMMGPSNLLLSADLPGAIERSFYDQSGVPAVFFNGAEGDVSPMGPRGDFREVDRLGLKIAGKVIPLWKALATVVPTAFKKGQVSVDLDEASLNILACLSMDRVSGQWTPILSAWPRKATITGFSINQQVFVGIPGEPSVFIGEGIRAQGANRGFMTTSV